MVAAAAQDDELDTGPKRAGVERFCALTRQVKPTAEMIRFVAGPDGAVVADLKRNLPGRGLWITGTREALREAVRRQVLPRGFRRELRVPPHFVETTEQLLERSALDALAMAGKAGLVASGFAKVEAALARGRVAVVIHASDGGADGIRKIDAMLRRQEAEENAGGMPQKAEKARTIALFTTAQLDLALGRSNVVHAALLAGPASDTFTARCLRLERFRTGNPGEYGIATARHQVARLGTE